MRRLSAREQSRIVAFVLSVGISSGIYLTLLLKPLWRREAKLAEQLRELREEVRGLETVTAGLERLQDQHRGLHATVSALQALLPPEAELPAVIELLSGLAAQSDVRIQTIFPQRTFDESALAPKREGGAMYKTVPIQIDALAGYHQLGTFLSLVESRETPMRLGTLRITTQPKDGKWHRIKLVIEAFFLPGAEAAGRDRTATP